jgi:hypothetical protein
MASNILRVCDQGRGLAIDQRSGMDPSRVLIPLTFGKERLEQGTELLQIGDRAARGSGFDAGRVR